MEGSYVPIIIFLVALIFIVFEVFEQSLVALLGALLLVTLNYLSPEQAIESISFETIVLLMAMMILVDISRKSGVFSWLNIRLVSITRGNPLLIFLLFSLLTAFFSTFLDNVTTILIVVPITIELFKGLGRDPKPLILGEIFMSNVGGALTLIGDPPNIIIGQVAKLSFNEFIINLWMPILASVIVLSFIIVAINWSHLKPIAGNLKSLLLSMVLIRKLEYKFLKMELSRQFIFKSLLILGLTIVTFVLQTLLGLQVHIIALLGAVLLAILASKEVHIHEALQAVEWTTLLFFAGLFVIVAGVEHTGILTEISQWVVTVTDDFTYMILLILWVSGFVSMILNNIPFVAVMIPVIYGIMDKLPNEPHLQLLWWSLALGSCIGGNGTIIGASANIIGVNIAKKAGIKISFLNYFKYSFPLTMISLGICSLYLLFRINYT